MIKQTIQRLEALLQGVAGVYAVRQYAEMIPFTDEKKTVRIPAYYEGNEYRMVAESDLQEGVLYLYYKDSGMGSRDKTGSGDGQLSVKFAVVGICKRSNLDCMEFAAQEVADNIIAQMAGSIAVSGVGVGWSDVYLVETDMIHVFNSEFGGTMPWSEEVACARVQFDLSLIYKNRCLTSRNEC